MPSALPEAFATGSGEQPDGPERDASEPASLAATFALERGVLLVPPTDLEFGGIEARVEGVIDLFLWALDLTLRSDEGPVLKLVGPLHRPHVRLIGAAGREQASPAPSASP